VTAPEDIGPAPRPYRVQPFGCYNNGGQRISKRPAREDDAYPVSNRASRRAAGQVRRRLFVNTSPRMRHGIDDIPRHDVMVRRLVRAAVKATS
jgi:hypothetical protein